MTDLESFSSIFFLTRMLCLFALYFTATKMYIFDVLGSCLMAPLNTQLPGDAKTRATPPAEILPLKNSSVLPFPTPSPLFPTIVHPSPSVVPKQPLSDLPRFVFFSVPF